VNRSKPIPFAINRMINICFLMLSLIRNGSLGESPENKSTFISFTSRNEMSRTKHTRENLAPKFEARHAILVSQH
jgi:hypothetical protein